MLRWLARSWRRLDRRRNSRARLSLDNALMFARELTLQFSISDPTADGAPLPAQAGEQEPRPERRVTHRLALLTPRRPIACSAPQATKIMLAP
jgi:hypothetical protein